MLHQTRVYIGNLYYQDDLYCNLLKPVNCIVIVHTDNDNSQASLRCPTRTPQLNRRLGPYSIFYYPVPVPEYTIACAIDSCIIGVGIDSPPSESTECSNHLDLGYII